MTDKEEEYHRYAAEAQMQANRAISERDKASWLKIAQSWLQLLPKSAVTAQDRFDDQARQRGTGQEGSEASN
jgi:hypothetical protein